MKIFFKHIFLLFVYVGLSTSSFKLYNKCKPGLGVKVKKLSKKIVEIIEGTRKSELLLLNEIRKAINFEAIVKKSQ